MHIVVGASEDGLLQNQKNQKNKGEEKI